MNPARTAPTALLHLQKDPVFLARVLHYLGVGTAHLVTHLQSSPLPVWRIGMSIGVTLFLGQELDADTLIQQAGTAMYLAKEAGRNQIRLHELQAA